jgi:hypothetical protein
MNGLASDFWPQIAALLAGGLGASLGVTYWVRSESVAIPLARLSRVAFTSACLIAVAVGIIAAYLLVRSIMRVAIDDPAAVSPMGLLLFGIAVGVPLGLPGVIATYAETRRRERARIERENRAPTREARRTFADQIRDQILEVSPRPRALSVSLTGDRGTILRLEGDVDATEGDRLTAALREDLRELGFERVEGRKGTAEWWSRV